MQNTGSYMKPLVLAAVILGLIVSLQWFGMGGKIAEARAWIEGLGYLGPFVFSALFALATVVAVPASALSIAAGAMFGSVVGTISVSAGSTAGAGLAFLVARYIARKPVERWLGKYDPFNKLDELTEKKGAAIVAVTRLIPLFPFHLLNYGFGLTRIKFTTYLFWSWLCMLPGTVLYVAGSDIIFKTAARGEIPWGILGLFAVFAAGLFFLIRFARGFLDAGAKRPEGKGQNEV